MLAHDITELIGKTPIVKMRKVVDGSQSEILLKLEYFNPGGSIKDRVGLNMILEAEKEGELAPGSVIIEPTSGNTGIGLAVAAAVRGYKLVLVMPETMSIERRQLLAAYGADIILTSGTAGMEGAVRKAEELSQEKGWFMPQQFSNPSNPSIHYRTTGPEILADTEGKLDYFVSTVGSGGTLTGTGQYLKEHLPGIKIIAVEPEASAVLSGGKPGPHKIQGIGPGFVPDVLQLELIDEIIAVSDEDAYNTTRRLAREEGILVGISSGAAVYAACHIARQTQPGTRILAIAPDSGERYLTTGVFDAQHEL